MINCKIYCCSIEHFRVLDSLPKHILPVGLGEKTFPKNWATEKEGLNISHLNRYYAEFTMFYWVWKNELKKMDKDDFVGNCQHKLLWLNEYYKKKQKYSPSSLYSKLLSPNNDIFQNNDLIHLSEITFSKKNLYEDFCIVHNKEFLEYSIACLPAIEGNKFRTYLNERKLYPMNMFITKVKYFEEYCSFIFPWMEKCFKFGEERNLYKGYNIRLIAFLMERFTSYWFERFKNKKFLSHAKLGRFHLSNRINKYVSSIKIPFTFSQYPTISKY